MFAALSLAFGAAALYVFQYFWPASVVLAGASYLLGSQSSVTGENIIGIVGVLGLLGMVLAIFGGAVEVWHY